MSKKIYLAALLGVAICMIIGWSVFMVSSENKKESLAKTFLTEIYQVKDHSRYHNLQSNLDAVQAIGGDMSSRDAAYKDYEELFNPLTTDKGYSQITTNSEYLKADSFALENGCLLEVKSVVIKESPAREVPNQYDYTVVVHVDFENGEVIEDMIAEGSLTMSKDADGVFRVNNFRPLRDVYSGPEVR